MELEGAECVAAAQLGAGPEPDDLGDDGLACAGGGDDDGQGDGAPHRKAEQDADRYKGGWRGGQQQ